MRHIHCTSIIDFIHFFQRNEVDLISKYAQPLGTTIIIMSTKRICVSLSFTCWRLLAAKHRGWISPQYEEARPKKATIWYVAVNL